MIEPYQAIGLVPTMRGIRHRDEISVNIEHLSHLIKAASWLSSLDLPVRLIAIPEGALQGFNDEVLDLDHETFARECAIDVPGPETDALGALARQWNAFLMGQAKARHPEFPGRFFNVGFVLNPDGEIVLRHHKVVPLLPVEHSVTPHNVWDKWIELYGRNLDAFYPVAIDLDIVVEYGVGIAELGRSIQRNVKQSVERMTGLRVVEVNVAVDDVYLPTDDDAQATPSRVS